MEETELRELFARYLAGEAGPEEMRRLIRQFGNKETEAELRRVIREQIESDEDESLNAQDAWQPALQETYEAIKAKLNEESRREGLVDISRKVSRGKWWTYSAAAAIALCIATAVLLVVNRPKQSQPMAVSMHKSDIAPGSNRATLTLANGTKIMLDSTRNGIISIQGNTRIIKPGSGLLTYHQSGNKSAGALFNTISTPRGGQYQVVLSDGTKLWLNAASSVRFPSEFTGGTRRVRVTGEVYFEVAANVNKPFEVLLNDMTVRVLGTHFNVMAYPNEPAAEVTLLEGAVKVIKGGRNILLKPGQQAREAADGGLIRVDDVDLQGTIAWKNNQFWFDGDDIQTVMRKLSRWYNVNVVIKGSITQHFGGIISRDLYVSKIFEALQATSHIQYEIQDSTIIVSP